MNEPSPFSFFASQSIIGHLARGMTAVGLVIYAYKLGDAQPVRSVIAGIAAVIMLRGCPMCWTIGLIETIRQRFK